MEIITKKTPEANVAFPDDLPFSLSKEQNLLTPGNWTWIFSCPTVVTMLQKEAKMQLLKTLSLSSCPSATKTCSVHESKEQRAKLICPGQSDLGFFNHFTEGGHQKVISENLGLGVLFECY